MGIYGFGLLHIHLTYLTYSIYSTEYISTKSLRNISIFTQYLSYLFLSDLDCHQLLFQKKKKKKKKKNMDSSSY